jgi:ribonuclease HII
MGCAPYPHSPMGRAAIPPPLPVAAGSVLGIDEAGRGSLVGPLVVGGFLVDADRIPELTAIGVRDSKTLSAARREEIYATLPSIGRSWAIPLPPRTVDRAVHRGKLNDLELDAFAKVVRQARPDMAFADACDPVAERFGRRLGAASGNCCLVHARHKADRDLPVVGAASIVAKVHRDRALGRLRARLGEELGSGYPSDRETVEFVRQTLSGGGPIPSWLRASWATTERLIQGRAARPLEAFDR